MVKNHRKIRNIKKSLNESILIPLRELFRREETIEEALELQDEFSIKSNLLTQLPEDYLSAFQFAPIQDHSFFVGRNQERNELKKALQRFREGRVCSVNITGEKGSGKSSFINVSEDIFKGYKVIRKEVTLTLTTSDELVAFLGSLFKQKNFRNIDDVKRHLLRTDRVIIILEGCHNFFIRIIGGFEALKDLLTLISMTNTRVLWLLTFNRFASNYLHKVVNLRNYFEYNIDLGPLAVAETEEMIDRRNQATDYMISFIPTRDQLTKCLNGMNGKRIQALMEANREHYFNRLANVSAGNPYVILFYWLNSLKKFFNIMFASQIEDYSFSFLREMDNQRVLALPLLLEHESLRLSQIAKVMVVGLSETRRMADFLVKKNVLIHDHADDMYVLNPLYVKPVRDFLRTKNLIPEG